MSVGTTIHPLLAVTFRPQGSQPAEPLLDELRKLGDRHDHCSARSRHLYEQLRKMLGQDRLTACLLGIQALAMQAEPAGARLLAAMLDANTPGSVLLPRVRSFRSTARLLMTDRDLVGDSFMTAWQERLADVVAACAKRSGRCAVRKPVQANEVADRAPLSLLQECFAGLIPVSAAMMDTGNVHASGKSCGKTMPADDQRLLTALIRLESEAYQERVSRLAGSVDPYRASAVMRVLPLLSRADAEIRDLDLLAAWLESGDLAQVFERRIPTGWDVLDQSERPRFMAALQGDPRLKPLADVVTVFLASPWSVPQLAGPTAKMLVLGLALVRAGMRDDPIHLIDAVRLVLTHTHDGILALSLNDELQKAIGCSLMASQKGSRDDLAGLLMRDGNLVVQQPDLTLGDRIWKHDLPTLQEMLTDETTLDEDRSAAMREDPSADAKKKQKALAKDASAQAVKQLVMNNVGSVSIVLGFLRNPKVTSIPGLVGEVVRRTRSARVLEVIAGDRTLTSGHANKDVPRALLESPVNISVKTLRQFIHVKFVSKTDLRRLAKDKARLRKEVCLEIEKYLDSLV